MADTIYFNVYALHPPMTEHVSS